MRTILTIGLAVLAIATAAPLFAAPNPQLKITIRGASLTNPIEITDGEPLTKFFYGSGPGNGVWSGPSFIVDWPRGVAKDPPRRLMSIS